MELFYKDLIDLKFVKIGRFFINDNPLKVKYNGNDDQVNVSLELVNDSFKRAEETVYLIYVDDRLVYVGEFSYNLQDRWLKRENYVWHNKDIEIEAELNKNKEVSLWLAVDPFAILPKNIKINISKSIEQEILRQYYPDWNKRGQMKKYEDWRKNNCVTVGEIIIEITKGPTKISSGQFNGGGSR